MFLVCSHRARLAGLLAAALAIAAGRSAVASETLPGPYPATVERVVDGDTLAVRVTIWLGQELSVLVRIRGIDAPEMRGRCRRERELAREAADHLTALTGGGPVRLTNIAGGKYHGRVVADVAGAGSSDLARAMLAPGLARRYDGGSRSGWCDKDETAATAAR